MSSDDISKFKLLEEENEKLRNELNEIKMHLKKYTAPASSKVYYEKHKEAQKQRVKEYQQRTNYKSDYKPTPEQKKEYNRREYLKRKEKLQKESEESIKNENI
jgi:phage protein D